MAHCMRAAVLVFLLTILGYAAAVSNSASLVLQSGPAAAPAVAPVGHMTSHLVEQLLQNAQAEHTTSSWHFPSVSDNRVSQQAGEKGQHEKRLLQDSRPYVIAHRGASGLLPEHTVPAYSTAIAQGADFIECDVVVTRDLQLICRHEPNLNTTTNAWALFRNKTTMYTIDGESVSGIFAADLLLAEIKQLKAVQPWPFRDHALDGAFSIPTLSEFLDVVLTAGRAVGIYPEVKHPTWHNSLPQIHAAGTSIEQLLVDALHARGYAKSTPVGSTAWRTQPIFIQSFEPTSLQKLAGMTPAPLLLLMGGWRGFAAPDTGITHEEMVGDDFLSELSSYITGVGPWKSSLYTVVQSSSSSSSNSSSSNSSSSSSNSSSSSEKDTGGAAPLGCKSLHCSNLLHPDVGRQIDSNSTGSSSSSSSRQRVQLQSTGLVAKLHSYGFQVHPYTLRDESQFVIEGCAGDIACEFAWLFDSERIDGGFADYPGTLHEWLVHRQRQQATALHDS